MLVHATLVLYILVGFRSFINAHCTQADCTAHEAGSTCCFSLGCCPAANNVCCSNQPTNCCSTNFPVCCGSGKGCCPRAYPVCCSSYCCPSGSSCCGKACCRRSVLTGRLLEINDRISQRNEYQQVMTKIHRI